MSAQPIERTDLGTDLIEALDFDPPCEHDKHGTQKRVHDGGPAYALVLVVRSCATCGEVERRKFYCRKFVGLLLAGHVFRCAACGRPSVHDVKSVKPVRP